jgi:hypothetical protein
MIPEDAARARRVIDGTARVLALRFVLSAPGSTRSEVAVGAGMSVPAAQVALRELEELGYITTDIAGPRNGRRIRYTAVPGSVGQDLDALKSWLLG